MDWIEFVGDSDFGFMIRGVIRNVYPCRIHTGTSFSDMNSFTYYLHHRIMKRASNWK